MHVNTPQTPQLYTQIYPILYIYFAKVKHEICGETNSAIRANSIECDDKTAIRTAQV